MLKQKFSPLLRKVTSRITQIRQIPPRACLKVLLLFAAAFLTGHLLARGVAALETAVSPVSESENWGLGFSEEEKRPTGNATIEELKEYDAWFAQDTEEKELYLTFDCGYENGNTPAILEALKNHNAPATFFVVGNFIRDNPELIRQMVEEGHTVGNHTYSHPDMSQISSPEAFEEELVKVEELYRKTTGEEMPRYYRPPRGVYSENNLKQAQDMGYTTVLWSLAYEDWYENDQPAREEALNLLNKRIHPGAIVLLHSTSKTNARILGELIDGWREKGYKFESIDKLLT